MLKRLIVVLVVSCVLFVVGSRVVMAQEADTCVTTTQYGGARQIVCGAHTPVETGLADINPIVLASVFFGAAILSTIKAKNLKRAEVAL